MLSCIFTFKQYLAGVSLKLQLLVGEGHCSRWETFALNTDRGRGGKAFRILNRVRQTPRGRNITAGGHPEVQL